MDEDEPGFDLVLRSVNFSVTAEFSFRFSVEHVQRDELF